MLAWLSSWENALLRAHEAEIPGTSSSQHWWQQFEDAVKGAEYESWREACYVANQEAINNDDLTLRKLSKDFNERIRKSSDNITGSIAKGAFPAYAKQREEEEQEEQREPRQRERNTNSHAHSYTLKRSRSRSPGP